MVRIDEEFKALIPPLTQEEYSALEQSILSEGCRDAIVTWNNIIVDGHNRYEICTKHNVPFKTVAYNFKDRDEAKEWMILNQFARRNINAYQRSVLALKLKPVIAEKAHGRKVAHVQNSAQAKTREQLATIAGVSHDTINKVERIEAIADESTKEALRRGDISVNKAYYNVKLEQRKAEQAAKIAEYSERPKVDGVIDIYTTTEKYRVIYADPPWSYNDKMDSPNLGGAVKHYPTMSTNEICELPIPAEDNAVLFLWVTSPLLEDSFKVIKAWGFKYKTSFIWDKVAHSMGHYNSVRHEFLLICTRGSCTPDVPKLLDSVVSIERTEHSVKPNEFREIIDTLYPIGNRLELFARRPAKGWDVWGNEV